MNVGYEGFANMQLTAFNGERVKSLKHLVRLAADNKEEFLRFELFRDQIVVLEAASVDEATTQICEDNSIPSPRSADLLDADAAGGDAHEPPSPLAGVQLGRPGDTEAEAEEAKGGVLGQQQQQQQPTAGINGGTPRQPSIAGSAVPARGKREPQQQSGRGAAGEGRGRGAEPRRTRLRSAAVTALRRVGASLSAPTKGGPRIEEGARFGRWQRGKDGGVESGERDRRMKRGRREGGD